MKIVDCFLLRVVLKGQCHEIFDPRGFLANSTPGLPGSQVEAVSNMVSYLQRYLFTKIYAALWRTVRKQFFVLTKQIFLNLI
jgi:hypothetical protein